MLGYNSAMRFPLLSATLLLIAGQAGASTLPARAPGLWQSTTTVTGPDGNPLPNASNIVTVSCVDPFTDAKFFTLDANACGKLKISGAGAKYAIDGACNQSGHTVTIHETLVYASPQSVTITASLKSPVGPETITSQLQWQGGCLPGMVPGDEGSLANGVFSKADNINAPNNP